MIIIYTFIDYLCSIEVADTKLLNDDSYCVLTVKLNLEAYYEQYLSYCGECNIAHENLDYEFKAIAGREPKI